MFNTSQIIPLGKVPQYTNPISRGIDLIKLSDKYCKVILRPSPHYPASLRLVPLITH